MSNLLNVIAELSLRTTWHMTCYMWSRRNRDSNPGSSTLEVDALTTRPTRRSHSTSRNQTKICRFSRDCLVGLVVKASASRAEDLGFESHLPQDIFWVESYQWLQNWHSSGYPARRLLPGTGRPGVSTLWLGEVESWICSFYLSVEAHKIAWADPSLRYTSMLLGH